MNKALYRQLKENWRYFHPISKVLANIDYFLETLSRKTWKIIKFYSKRIEVKNL